MKVLLVNDYGRLSGGAEVSIALLRDGLRARGHQAHVLATSAATAGAPFADRWCWGTTGRLRLLLQYHNPFAAWALRRALAELRPDIVHVHIFLTQLSPSILPVLEGVPAVQSVVWYRPVCPLGTKCLPSGAFCERRAGEACREEGCVRGWKWRLHMRQLARYRRRRKVFRRLLAVSEKVRQELLKDGLDPAEIEVHHLGVPEDPGRPPLADPPTVAFAGRLVREKGCHVLIEAFAIARRAVPGARLLIAGEGPDLAALESRARALGLEGAVEWLGQLSPEEVQRGFAPAWVQAVPSIFAEPFGLVAPEAMHRGTAVIASRTGGLADTVLDGETGFLLPPGDVESLAAALARVLADSKLAERLGAQGLRRARERFGLEGWTDRMVDVYERTIRECRGGA